MKVPVLLMAEGNELATVVRRRRPRVGQAPGDRRGRRMSEAVPEGTVDRAVRNIVLEPRPAGACYAFFLLGAFVACHSPPKSGVSAGNTKFSTVDRAWPVRSIFPLPNKASTRAPITPPGRQPNM